MTKKIASPLFEKSEKRRAAKPLDAAQFARVLAAWFQTAQRDLPWRRAENARDAYRVLVSEMMLQQTTVAAVVPFYQRFLARFPDVKTLAAASIEDVLPLWEGLGYYRRARMLHACAREVCEKYDGVFPRDVARVLALPGIGRYTAGAVSSIAHEIAAPIVDANVARVFARIFLIEGDTKSGGAQSELWKRATQIVEAAHANDVSPATVNPALMELGALLCTPRAPRCESCPVQNWCGAFAENRQSELPFVAPRRAPIELLDVCVFARYEADPGGEDRSEIAFAENVTNEIVASTRGGEKCADVKIVKNHRAAPREETGDFPPDDSALNAQNRDETAASTRDENARILLRQRPHDANVWWRGMWELPRATRQGGESEETALRRLLQEELGFEAADFSLGEKLRRVKHGVTHHAISLDCYEVIIRDGATPRTENALWLSWREIEELALPTSMRFLVKWLRERDGAAAKNAAQLSLGW